MLYLAALNLAVGLCVWILARSLVRARAGTEGGALAELGITCALLLMLAPVVLEVLQLSPAGSLVFQWGLTYLDGWITALGAILGLAGFGRNFLGLRRSSAPGFWIVGANVLGLLLSVYMGLVAYKHESFYWGSAADDHGMLNLMVMRDSKDGEAVTCPADIVAVKSLSADLIAYRCPLTIALGMMTTKPFIPWPGYVDGKSQQLGKILREMQDDALQAK